jgi:hypothetical protein
LHHLDHRIAPILGLIGILSFKQGDEPLCMLAKTQFGWG